MLKRFLLPVLFAFLISGCGYTQQTVLPQNVKTIYVETVKNKIELANLYAYVPGLEIGITNAIIRRLEKDGNLKVVKQEEADAILECELTRFEQEGVRFTSLESVGEYRLFIVVNAKLINAKTKQVIWQEPNFSGDADYFVSGVRSLSREQAADQAIDRLARNMVDRIVEDW